MIPRNEDGTVDFDEAGRMMEFDAARIPKYDPAVMLKELANAIIDDAADAVSNVDDRRDGKRVNEDAWLAVKGLKQLPNDLQQGE